MREAGAEKRDWRKDPLFRSIIGVGALLATLTVAALLYGGSGPITVELAWFVPLVNTILLVAALCVAFLAFSRFYVLRCTVSYWLGVASVVLGVGLVFWILTWPGLTPGGRAILGDLPSTPGWMAAITQILLAVFLLAAAVAKRPGKSMKVILLNSSLAGWLLFALSIHTFFLFSVSHLPVLVTPSGEFTPIFLVLHWIALALYVAGIMLSARQYLISGNALSGFIAICQSAIACAVLIMIIGANRYNLPWYTARVLTAGSYLVIMFGLLSEYVGLYRLEQEKSIALDRTLIELRESRDRLILAQQAGHVGIFDWSIRTGKLIWTAQLEAMFGLPAGGFEGNYEAWAKRLHPEDRPRVESRFRQWTKEGRRQVEFEHRIIRADTAEVRWVAVRAQLSYLPDGTPARMIGTKLDITEQKQAEDALKRSEAMMSQAGEMASLGAWEIKFTNHDDLDKNPLHWSDEVYRIFGYKPGSVEVTNEFFWKHVHPDDRRMVSNAVAEALENKTPYEIEHRIIRPDGTEGIVSEHADIRFDGQGRPLEMVGAVQDITGRKRAEQALRDAEVRLQRANAELESRVTERTAELERRNKELQEFAFIASHDLKEPLRKIRAFGDLVVDRSRDALTQESAGFLSRMQSAAARMQVLLESLLDYSRVTTKGRSFKEVNLGFAVQEALSNLEMRIKETNASIEVEDLPSDIEGDDIQLVQLFQNLLGNALKFHEDGREPRIKIYSRPMEDGGSNVQVYIEDEGIGFDEKYLDKIFEPFQRLHGRDGYEGVGMGLAICKKIVERHMGTLTAKSIPGKGSTFVITLPAKHGQNEFVKSDHDESARRSWEMKEEQE